MKLLNFDLASPNNTVELRAVGLNWDLHNFADFEGIRVAPDGSVALTWSAPDTPNPWGDTGNHFGGCELRFRGVRRLSVTGREPSMPASEDRTLAGISQVADLMSKNRDQREAIDTQFSLLLKFQSGVVIDVDAAEAEFVPIDRGQPISH